MSDSQHNSNLVELRIPWFFTR